ncbi:cistern family PEP-CTERM protein [Leptolyngbya sp. FACHB-17]|uniref:cistern family PEP-CTERM protein n=1 Tax=Leptolyngbya sp. FACHB-17 TaxID=2692803 RepID=UPI001A7E3421|nr:cistern family PEP-CTERM protein [Leptolyngbya sp. FACHB-17]
MSFAILTLCSGVASLGLLLAANPAFAQSNTTSTQTTAPTQSATPSTSSFTVGLADLGKIFRINFDGNVDTKTVNGMTSFADFTFQGFTSQGGNTIARFDVLLDNTTGGDIFSRVSALGFNTSATLINASTSGLFGDAHLNGAFPNQFGNVGVCFTNGNTCQGGTSGGVNNSTSLPGTFDKGTFSFSLALSGNVNTLSLSNFGVRYQSIDSKSLGFNGESGTGRGTSVTTVTPPPPTTVTPPPPTTVTPPPPTTVTPPPPTTVTPPPPLFDKPIDGTPPGDQPTTPPVSPPTSPKPPTPKPTKVPEPGTIAALALVSAIALKYRKQQEADAEA